MSHFSRFQFPHQFARLIKASDKPSGDVRLSAGFLCAHFARRSRGKSAIKCRRKDAQINACEGRPTRDAALRLRVIDEPIMICGALLEVEGACRRGRWLRDKKLCVRAAPAGHTQTIPATLCRDVGRHKAGWRYDNKLTNNRCGCNHAPPISQVNVVYCLFIADGKLIAAGTYLLRLRLRLRCLLREIINMVLSSARAEMRRRAARTCARCATVDEIGSIASIAAIRCSSAGPPRSGGGIAHRNISLISRPSSSP